MFKRTMLVIVVVLSILCLGACDLFKTDKGELDLSKRGLQYYFSGNMYDTVEANFSELFTYSAPEMECSSSKNSRLYKGDESALLIWMGDKSKKVSKSNILEKYSENILEYIKDASRIDTVGVKFDLNMVAEDVVNEIDRNKYVGEIDAIGIDGVDISLKTVIYTFVIEGRPGCVLGVVTNREQSKKEFDEIEANAQVMINTVKKR